MSICPKCNKKYYDYPALSRKDNKTEICPNCGLSEALDSLKEMESNNSEKDEYIQDLEEENENLSEYNRLLIERIKGLENV